MNVNSFGQLLLNLDGRRDLEGNGVEGDGSQTGGILQGSGA
jgi:hypothetical protein